MMQKLVKLESLDAKAQKSIINMARRDVSKLAVITDTKISTPVFIDDRDGDIVLSYTQGLVSVEIFRGKPMDAARHIAKEVYQIWL